LLYKIQIVKLLNSKRDTPTWPAMLEFTLEPMTYRLGLNSSY